MGQKRRKAAKKRRKIAKISPKSKEKFGLTCLIFWLPSLLKFCPGMIYIYIYIIPEKKDFMATFESFFMFFVIFLTLTLAIRCQDAYFLFQVGKP